ncbi:hypothetical protein GGR56DRAFT_336384 [Xylariaceae sp. FL0804]|nr:hypothetical protein GGR56DRAFT_336384 [Xylariaceae sp. FL0804]
MACLLLSGYYKCVLRSRVYVRGCRLHMRLYIRCIRVCGGAVGRVSARWTSREGLCKDPDASSAGRMGLSAAQILPYAACSISVPFKYHIYTHTYIYRSKACRRGSPLQRLCRHILLFLLLPRKSHARDYPRNVRLHQELLHLHDLPGPGRALLPHVRRRQSQACVSKGTARALHRATGPVSAVRLSSPPPPPLPPPVGPPGLSPSRLLSSRLYQLTTKSHVYIAAWLFPFRMRSGGRGRQQEELCDTDCRTSSCHRHYQIPLSRGHEYLLRTARLGCDRFAIRQQAAVSPSPASLSETRGKSWQSTGRKEARGRTKEHSTTCVISIRGNAHARPVGRNSWSRCLRACRFSGLHTGGGGGGDGTAAATAAAASHECARAAFLAHRCRI